MKGITAYIVLSVVFFAVNGCAEHSDEPVEIGAVYPLSGPQGAVGKEIKQGIELAVDIINNEYPQLNLPLAGSDGLANLDGRPIQVVYADHQSTQAIAREKTRQLIAENEVTALIGAYESANTRVASEVAEAAGIPFLTATSTSPELTGRGFQWFFRTTPTDTTFVTNVFQFMNELNSERNAGLQRLAVIHEGTDFGKGTVQLVTALAPQYGMQVVAEIVPQGTAESVPGEVDQVRAAQPDAVLFAVFTDDAVRFIQEFKRQSFAPPLIWANDAGFISPEFEALGADAAYVTSREVWSLDITRTNPLAAQVNALYRDRYGVDLNGNSARSFIGIMTLADAINRAASTEPSAVRAALVATDIPVEQLITPWRGIRFDDMGQNVLGDGIVVEMLNNRYTLVWPFAIAVEPVVFPFPQWSAR